MPTNVEVAPTPEEQKERESHEHVSVSYGYEVGVSSDHLVSSHTNTAMHRFHDSVVQSIVKMEPGMDYNEHATAALIAIAQAEAQIQPPPLPRCSRTRQLPSLPLQAWRYPEVIQSVYTSQVSRMPPSAKTNQMSQEILLGILVG